MSVLAVLFGLTSIPCYADEVSPEELERWFNDDSMDPPRYTAENDASDVNEGELVFLPTAPEKKALHHHHNSLTIFPQSLVDGWVLLTQCHANIDKVSAAQIVFDKNRIKNIEIVSYKNIDKVWVEGPSVQMENIHADAEICVKADTRSFIKQANGEYQLKNGPFMRRFLDGYYPLRVTFELNYAGTNLQLVDYSPTQQSGYTVNTHTSSLNIDTIFEGKLITEFNFKEKSL